MNEGNREDRNMGARGPAGAAGPSVPEESYALVARGQNYRVGVVAERPLAGPPAHSMEFLLRLFETGQKLEPGEMEKAMAIVSELMDNGYSVCFQDDGWVCCEKPVDGERIRDEAGFLAGLVEGL
jgi:hypothetical protein